MTLFNLEKMVLAIIIVLIALLVKFIVVKFVIKEEINKYKFDFMWHYCLLSLLVISFLLPSFTSFIKYEDVEKQFKLENFNSKIERAFKFGNEAVIISSKNNVGYMDFAKKIKDKWTFSSNSNNAKTVTVNDYLLDILKINNGNGYFVRILSSFDQYINIPIADSNGKTFNDCIIQKLGRKNPLYSYECFAYIEKQEDYFLIIDNNIIYLKDIEKKFK